MNYLIVIALINATVRSSVAGDAALAP